MKAKFHAKIVYEFDYAVDSIDYGTDDIKKMIKIDTENMIDDPSHMIDDKVPVVTITKVG